MQKIDKIRAFYRKNKAQHYPIENDKLQELDEYNKSLYIKVLCSIASYAEEVSELQTMFLQRLIAGCACEGKLEDYMKKALDIKIEDYNEFIEQYKNNELKYRFCVDGMILVGVSTTSGEKQLDLLCEIIELLKVSTDEINYLSQVAGAIIEQSSELFNKAQENKVEQIKNELFFGYIKNFYVGLYVDEYNEKHYYASELSCLDIDIEGPITTNTVIFENLIISIDKYWCFEGNEKVVFKNCHITGNEHNFNFKFVGKVKFEGCRLDGFQNRVAYVNQVNNIYITNSIFDKCGYSYKGYAYGGLFSITGGKTDKVSLVENQFLNCYIKSEETWGGREATGVIIDANSDYVVHLEVKKCKFIGCQCKNYTYGEALLISRIHVGNQLIEENEYIGGVQDLMK